MNEHRRLTGKGPFCCVVNQCWEERSCSCHEIRRRGRRSYPVISQDVQILLEQRTAASPVTGRAIDPPATTQKWAVVGTWDYPLPSPNMATTVPSTTVTTVYELQEVCWTRLAICCCNSCVPLYHWLRTNTNRKKRQLVHNPLATKRHWTVALPCTGQMQSVNTTDPIPWQFSQYYIL